MQGTGPLSTKCGPVLEQSDDDARPITGACYAFEPAPKINVAETPFDARRATVPAPSRQGLDDRTTTPATPETRGDPHAMRKTPFLDAAQPDIRLLPRLLLKPVARPSPRPVIWKSGRPAMAGHHGERRRTGEAQSIECPLDSCMPENAPPPSAGS